MKTNLVTENLKLISCEVLSEICSLNIERTSHMPQFPHYDRERVTNLNLWGQWTFSRPFPFKRNISLGLCAHKEMFIQGPGFPLDCISEEKACFLELKLPYTEIPSLTCFRQRNRLFNVLRAEWKIKPADVSILQNLHDSMMLSFSTVLTAKRVIFLSRF